LNLNHVLELNNITLNNFRRSCRPW